MSDLGELFSAWKKAKKKVKEDRLESTSDSGWEKHTKYHWFKIINGEKLDFWPSTGRCLYKGRYSNINSKFAKKLLKESSNEGN